MNKALAKNISLFSRVIRNFSQGKPDKLFTPGPLLTTESVKLSMNWDYGSRDPQFINIVKEIREKLLEISHVTSQTHTSVLMQGSGTFGVEATLGTSIPKTKHKLLIIANGAYGERMAKIATILNLNHIVLRYKDNEVVKNADVQKILLRNTDTTHVSMIHSETTSGLINPIDVIGATVKDINPKITFIVDAMSSFGAYDIAMKDSKIDYLVSSSNKCLQGVPGFSFVIANKENFLKTEYNARSLSLNLFDQWRGLEENGQFRFTPPTHVLKAFHTALHEFTEQGGVLMRNKRYSENQKLLSARLSNLGFKLYIDPKFQGCIITTFLQPTHPNFDFKDFYNYLASKKMIIYPGKLTEALSFRVGSIGELYKEDMELLCKEIENYLNEKHIPIPITYEDNHHKVKV